jgi:hypothetical protein
VCISLELPHTSQDKKVLGNRVNETLPWIVRPISYSLIAIGLLFLFSVKIDMKLIAESTHSYVL